MQGALRCVGDGGGGRPTGSHTILRDTAKRYFHTHPVFTEFPSHLNTRGRAAARGGETPLRPHERKRERERERERVLNF